MGVFEFGPVSVIGAAGFSSWTRQLIDAIRQLVDGGEVNPIPYFEEVVALYGRILVALEDTAQDARQRGQVTIDLVSVEMSVAEHRQLKDVGRAIESYVGLLATRGLLDMDMRPDEAACMTALIEGAHRPA